MTIHEVQQVEIGKAYIGQFPSCPPHVVLIRETETGVVGESAFGTCFVCNLQNRGIIFYGPIELKPAQESAAGGKRL